MICALTILFTALLLIISVWAGDLLYKYRTDCLIREARRLRHFNNIVSMTREHAESE